MIHAIVNIAGLLVLAAGVSGRAGVPRDAPDPLWDVLREQPVKGEAIVGWTRGVAVSARAPVSAEEREAILGSFRALPGVEVVRADDQRPYAILKLASPEALKALQALPRVAYVEPRYVRLQTASSSSTEPYTGFQQFEAGWQVNFVVDGPRFEPFTDYVPWNFVDLAHPPRPLPFTVLPGFRGHRIVDAWRRKGGGRGARISVVDSGVATALAELGPTCPTCSSGFAGGLSGPRTMEVYDAYDGSPIGDEHGHGTAAVSTALAPLSARGTERSIVGVAWEADGASVRIDDDVFVNWADVDRAVLGIRRAVCGEADACVPHEHQIVSMAWGDFAEHEALKAEIEWWARQGVLFLGAAGTLGCRWNSEPLYPAAQTPSPGMDNPVLAVTCVNPTTGARSDGVCKSFELAGVWRNEWAGKDDWPALGREPGTLVKFGSSSGCVSTVAGIAALTWAAHPHDTRDEIIQRLHAAGRFGNAETGSGVVDAFLAVGGLGDASIQGPTKVPAGSPYQLGHARSSGDGPFRFEWTDGACNGNCDFDRATGSCRGPCPLVGSCAAGHPQCEGVTLTAPAAVGARQATKLRVIDEGSDDPSADFTVATDSRTVCARSTAQCSPAMQCGGIPDGCGAVVSCGTCAVGQTCRSGRCLCASSKFCDL